MAATLLSAVILGCFLLLLLRIGRRERGLPPGPSTVPLLGNLHLLPNAAEMPFKFMEWSRKYGDIISVKSGSSTMIILSSPRAIKEVVDKQGWASSSRPVNYLAGVAAGGYHILFAQDTPQLRNLKKAIARFFSLMNSLSRVPVQAAESTQLLHELMTQPENFDASIRRYTHSIAMVRMEAFEKNIADREEDYDLRATSTFFDLAADASMLHRFLHIQLPGVYPPIDLLPVLKYLPERWAPWRAACRRSNSEMAAFHLHFASAAEARSAERGESFMDFISGMDLSAEEYDIFSHTGFALVEAGSDTNSAFVLSLVLVLSIYPEHQERARREIEAVVGTARLPELADFGHMPFVEALIREIIRIRPSFPIGVPHLATEDIRASFACQFARDAFPNGVAVVVQGLRRAEGRYGHLEYVYVVFAWQTVLIRVPDSVFHSPEIFEEPEVFNPDRFLKSEHGTRPGMDADFRDNFLFGGGRRICPGQYAARGTMQLTTMRLIWAFRFGSAVNPKTGQPEFVVMPYPFECAIEPRSNERRELVEQAFNDSRSLLQRYEH
ncbi:cytochrome P450 [Mycena alexandri]|uniref:Cytochrome P450 n=1 Tax=Mycena alexandri TaxID=1745969 RepID=A0AAD6X5G4_9AGAR|nr:cytochrome P450 [Mycena alexandri]